MICTANRMLSSLMVAMAALVFVALLTTTAQAHDGHSRAAEGAEVSAPHIEPVVAPDKAMTFNEPAPWMLATVEADDCQGHCCFSGTCCSTLAGAVPAIAVFSHPLAATSADRMDAFHATVPDGLRRPPKRHT